MNIKKYIECAAACGALEIAAALSAAATGDFGPLYDLPWGPQGRFGRWRVTRQSVTVGGATRVVEALCDGLPVARARWSGRSDNLPYGGILTERQRDAARLARREWRAANRARHVDYLVALDEAVFCVTNGIPLGYTEGGVFWLPGSRCVSAAGLFKRLHGRPWATVEEMFSFVERCSTGGGLSVPDASASGAPQRDRLRSRGGLTSPRPTPGQVSRRVMGASANEAPAFPVYV